MDNYSVYVYNKFRSFVIAYENLTWIRACRLYKLAKNRVNTGFVFLKDGSRVLKKYSHICTQLLISAKIDEYVKFLPKSMKNFNGCNAVSRCRGLGE